MVGKKKYCLPSSKKKPTQTPQPIPPKILKPTVEIQTGINGVHHKNINVLNEA